MKTMFAAIMFLVLAVTAQAGSSVGSAVEVEIRTDNGRVLPLYPAASRTADRRVYAEAVKGEQYTIAVRNRLDRKVGIVVAVDGRNIISGKKSWLRNNERMYILEPYGYGEYNGWRTGQDQVNRFYFTDVPDSYAAAFDDTSAMGVISVAVYPELVRMPQLQEHSMGMGAQRAEKKARAAAPSPALDKSESAGTGYGRQEYSPSRIVTFDPEPNPAEKIFVKYEWHKTLCSKGIISCGKQRVRTHNRLWDDDYAPAPPCRN